MKSAQILTFLNQCSAEDRRFITLQLQFVQRINQVIHDYKLEPTRICLALEVPVSEYHQLISAGMMYTVRHAAQLHELVLECAREREHVTGSKKPLP